MPLRLKLRHALGEATFELHDGPDRQPHVIGRGAAATIEVPSLRVAPRHCAIFFHQGRWILQDGNTRIGTQVNGRFLPGSRAVWPLSTNDLIRLGDDYHGPVLLVEDVAVPDVAADIPTPMASRPAHPRGSREQWPVAMAIEPPAPEAPPSETPLVDWSSPVPLLSPVRGRTRPSTRLGPAGILVMALGSAAVVGIGGGAYWTLRPGNVPASAPSVLVSGAEAAAPPAAPGQAANPAEARVETSPARPPTTFEPTDHDPAPAAPASLPDAAGLIDEIAGLPPEHPARQSPAWARVVAGHAEASPRARLIAYDRFMSESGPGPLQEAVAAWQQEALDLLWWERIRALLDEEFALIDRRIEIESDLRLLPASRQAERAGALAEEQRVISQRLSAISRELSEDMSYDAGLIPDLANSGQLDRLRLARDAERFGVWKQRVLEALTRNGRLPWEQGEFGRSA